MTEISLRAATPADCRAIAMLYRMSSDGVADYIWSKLAAPGEDILDVGERRYARSNTDFSYQNCTMAELSGTPAGMLSAFPMHVDPEAAPDPDPDPVLSPYAILEEDNSYYVCGVAVFPEYRGRGIGTRLMAKAEERAREKGFSKLSLIVFEKNSGAKRLYERLSYYEAARAAVVPHPLIHMDGDAVLMVKRLA